MYKYNIFIYIVNETQCLYCTFNFTYTILYSLTSILFIYLCTGISNSAHVIVILYFTAIVDSIILLHFCPCILSLDTKILLFGQEAQVYRSI